MWVAVFTQKAEGGFVGQKHDGGFVGIASGEGIAWSFFQNLVNFNDGRTGIGLLGKKVCGRQHG